MNSNTSGWLVLTRNFVAGSHPQNDNVTVRALELHFRKTAGKTPKAWMARQRQKQGKELLRDGTSVKETAAQLGYKRAHHFSREFKRYWGLYPTQTIPKDAKLRILV